MKNTFPPLFWRLLFAAALLVVALLGEARAACDQCDDAYVLAYAAPPSAPQGDSWIFARSRYSHDPDTGDRVAQYERIAPVEPLPDQRAITSGYRRKRTVLRGIDGSSDTTYQVQNYGNGRGELNAEWERSRDAWRGSNPGGYGQGYGGNGGYPGYGYGQPGYGYGYGGYPGYGYGQPSYGYGGNRGYGQGNQRGYGSSYGYGPGYGRPDAGWLTPDGADGYRDGVRRTPDREFFGHSRHAR